MMSSTASEISPAVAAWPIARPSEKLCRPIPTAIAMPVRRAASAASWRVVVSAVAMAPGPMLVRGRGFHSRVAYSSPSRPAPKPSA